jgi:hypothetical protein
MKVGSPDGKPTADGHFVAWYKIVQDYSGKALSVRTDRLPAISALVKTFSRLPGAHSVAGLWLEDLDREGFCGTVGNEHQPIQMCKREDLHHGAGHRLIA